VEQFHPDRKPQQYQREMQQHKVQAPDRLQPVWQDDPVGKQEQKQYEDVEYDQPLNRGLPESCIHRGELRRLEMFKK
jgi:hypothetical protein